VSPPFLSLDIVSLRIITLSFVVHDGRIKAFFPQVGEKTCFWRRKKISSGDEIKRVKLNAVVFVRDEFRRIMPAIE
jgi:hypothetical protein